MSLKLFCICLKTFDIQCSYDRSIPDSITNVEDPIVRIARSSKADAHDVEDDAQNTYDGLGHPQAK